MSRFPHINELVNEVFAKEKHHWDYRFLRPLIMATFFVFRMALFPVKLLLHRTAWGFEAYAIDWWMTFGIKYLARHDAAELMIRHTQIEPILYRHILRRQDISAPATKRKLNGIDGDFSLESLEDAKQNRMTVGHDLLSYELVDRFNKEEFLNQVEWLRRQPVEDHDQYSKRILEENRKHSFQILGITNIVHLVVFTIALFGDLRTTLIALNSFGSDSVLLWGLKHLYANDPKAQVTLDFFLHDISHRGHHECSIFFSNPNQYLYYHIVFHEVAYELLRDHPPFSQTETRRTQFMQFAHRTT